MIVVTGAAGFIGSNVVLELNRRGHRDVLAVDTLDGPTKHRNLNAADLLDLVEPEDFLADLERLQGVEAVIHEGACSDTTESDGLFMMRNNYRYTQRLATWCMDHDVPFVYASSASVYGGGEHGFVEQRSCEDPLNVYAYSKFLFDQWARRHARDRAVVGLRYYNVYGPQEHHKGRMASVVLKFHGQARRGETLQVFEGSESFLRDFVYVDDAVDVTLHFMDAPGRGGIFNVGTGTPRSFLDIAQIVSARTGAVVERIPFPEDLRGRYQAFTQADLGLLRAAGYDRPFASLEHGVGAYLQILDESDGYRVRRT